MFQISKADNKVLRGLKQNWDEDEYGIAFNRVLARHILQERHRHGGDFVVAWALADDKERRDVIRKIVGPELIFVVLTTLDQSLLEKRRKDRERIYLLSKGKKPTSCTRKCPKCGWTFGMSKPNGSEHERHDRAMDEYKVINIEITAEMKVEDTANKIIELIEYM